MRYIRILEENFEPRPIVLFYEDMRDDPKRFILDLARRMNEAGLNVPVPAILTTGEMLTDHMRETLEQALTEAKEMTEKAEAALSEARNRMARGF